MHTPQSGEGLQINRIGAHREIVALHQWHTELTSQIGVLEVGFVEGSRCKDDGQRRFLAGEVGKTLLHDGRKARQRPHAQFTDQSRVQPRHDLPILQRIAQA